MAFNPDWTDQRFNEWLATLPSEDEFRDAYLTLESHRASLWTPGHLSSYRRDRYDLDACYVGRLVEIKKALARHWVRSGQVTGTELEASLA